MFLGHTAAGQLRCSTEEIAMPEAACTDHGLRQEVATCTRLLQMLGILGYSGHVSVRVPGDEAFLIQPIDRSRADVVPSDLMLVDLSGDLIPDEDGENELRPPSERFIHSEILRARGDVNAVAHFHEPEKSTDKDVDKITQETMQSDSSEVDENEEIETQSGSVDLSEKGENFLPKKY